MCCLNLIKCATNGNHSSIKVKIEESSEEWYQPPIQCPFLSNQMYNVYQSLLSDQKIQLIHSKPIRVNQELEYLCNLCTRANL